MKCPMKFNNPCSDADDQCEGDECMWYVGVNGFKSCAVSWSAVELVANMPHIDFEPPASKGR